MASLRYIVVVKVGFLEHYCELKCTFSKCDIEGRVPSQEHTSALTEYFG